MLPKIILLGRVSVILSRPAIMLLFRSVLQLSFFKRGGLQAEGMSVVTPVELMCLLGFIFFFSPTYIICSWKS